MNVVFSKNDNRARLNMKWKSNWIKRLLDEDFSQGLLMNQIWSMRGGGFQDRFSAWTIVNAGTI